MWLFNVAIELAILSPSSVCIVYIRIGNIHLPALMKYPFLTPDLFINSLCKIFIRKKQTLSLPELYQSMLFLYLHGNTGTSKKL